ncbi:hypothetical protein [Moosepox virus GoldyGopher14]|uniref:S-S bond formation pathway protein n=1 Tax=Deerpox virus (strain Mule deer/United States/W-848-83/1983) TaxID=305674 RepID=Q08FQ0_DPV83|nr:hypothetical protein DpV83gp102 [Deerpox virus W-848-83]ABI99257.1 hypothetical protein DpV83gp102 [Deerpox virus W-848-83]AYC44776.1 hypothetical protein [Moosepox virus GoldyGopher14]
MTSWYDKYHINLNPPRRCSRCLANLFEFLSEDSETIKMVLESQPNKLRILKEFLSACRNKEFIYKILDDEIKRVLT